MSTAATVREIGRQLDDPASLGRAFDDLFAEPPALLALGEPTHGVEAFPLLRNELLAVLVDRGYRSVVLETDILAASTVDGYVNGAAGELDSVLANGFSHGFGGIPGNRELVSMLRARNADHPPRDRVRFYGCDAPVEFHGADSPRRALSVVRDHLPAPMRPASARDLDALLGDDADWTNQAAMFDPAASVGGSDRARALRIVADDLADALHRAAPALRPADPAGYAVARTHARTATGLLRYHAAMAAAAPDRLAVLRSMRAAMMAENLLAILAAERDRGPTLVFLHNGHVQRAPSPLPDGPEVVWANAGALVADTLGARYAVIATDANPNAEPGTLQGALAAATARRALFPAPALRAALDPSTRAGAPIVAGHIPLNPGDLHDVDAVLFVADTDGKRVQFW